MSFLTAIWLLPVALTFHEAENLVPVVYVMMLVRLTVPTLIQTIKAGNTFIALFRAISHIGMTVSNWLYIP
jgi:hypothetical protein